CYVAQTRRLAVKADGPLCKTLMGVYTFHWRTSSSRHHARPFDRFAPNSMRFDESYYRLISWRGGGAMGRYTFAPKSAAGRMAMGFRKLALSSLKCAPNPPAVRRSPGDKFRRSGSHRNCQASREREAAINIARGYS